MQPNNPVSPAVPQPVTLSPAPASPAPEAPSDYISNPFLNSVRGLVQMLKVNPVSVMLSGLVGLVGIVLFFIGQIIVTAFVTNVGNPATIVIVGLVAAVVLLLAFLVLCGSYNVIAGRSVRNEVVSVGESYRVAFKRVFGYLVLFLIYWLLTGLLSILLVVPGIYFATRASLAFFVFYEENLGPWASIKRSFSLTSGHFMEMLGAIVASSLLGGGSGLLSGAISLSPLVGRYHDFKNLKDSGAQKPKVHYLNTLIVVLTLLFVVIYAGLVVILAVSSKNSIQDRSNTFNQSQFNSGSFNSNLNSGSGFNSSPDTMNVPSSTYSN